MALEMAFILIFTVVIIWLARKGLDFVIKAIVMLALGLSLFYIVYPYTWLLLSTLGVLSIDLIFGISVAICISLMAMLLKYPEW